MHNTVAVKSAVENPSKLSVRPHISVYIATSMDGFIAKENDELDWLENINPPDCHEDYGFNEFLSSIDTMIMGRGTYTIASSVEDWPYKGKRVVVLSKSLQEVRKDAELYKGDIVSLVQKLHTEGARHIYIYGGATISQFIDEGLVDQIIISIVPVILGKGISLFKNMVNESWFELVLAQPYPNGLVQLRYRRKK